MIEVIPTTVPHDLDGLIDATHKVASFSKKLHVDINDGIFTGYVSWPYVAVEKVGPIDIAMLGDVELEAHLMVRQPRILGVHLIQAGVRTIIGHIEACADADDAREMLTTWRTVGAHEVGLAIRVETRLDMLGDAVSSADFVHIMSVGKIGAQGAPFDPRAIERIRTLHMAHHDVKISVDGSINEKNIADLVSAGATRLCVGSAIMKPLDPVSMYRHLVDSAQRAESPTTHDVQ